MNLHWLLRMSQWARNPPSMRRVLLVIAVVAICAAIFIVERYIGWPEALTATSVRPPRP